MSARRRPVSLLEDDNLVAIDNNRDESAAGDICEGCSCTREAHELSADGSCACGKCPKFKESE